MKIGILQTGYLPDELQSLEGDYGAMFPRILDGHGFTFQTWAVVDMQFPEGPHDADGWIITGSRHGAYEDLPFIAPLEDLIRDIYKAGVPTVGVCFGHQIIAQALGGKVVKFEGGWAVGRTEYNWQGETVAINAWHQDQVIERPDNARVIASNDFCENAALVYGDKMWTVQAHPEFSEISVNTLADVRGRGVVPDDLLDQAIALSAVPTDRMDIAAKMASFLKQSVET